MSRVAIIGTGMVGQAIGKGLARTGHEVHFGTRSTTNAKVPPGTLAVTQKEAANWGEIVFFAVPYRATKDTVRAIGPDTFNGKVLVDVTNALGPTGELAVGHTTSAAEELAKLVPGAKVVKAFNTVFAKSMSTGTIGKDKITLFVAGDDKAAKKTVMDLGRDIGFDPADSGPLSSARYLEPLAKQMMVLAFSNNMGPGIGLKLLKTAE